MKKIRQTIFTVFGIKNLNETESIVRKLSEGFDVNAVDSGGRTLLMQAAIDNNHELVKILLDHGADPNIREERNWTALHFAVQEYNPFSTKLLLKKGADVNAQDDYGNSVVSRAVMNSRGRGDVIQLLCEYGADVNLKNRSGISALDSAKNIANYDIVPFLQ